jgi:hypothetical protein
VARQVEAGLAERQGLATGESPRHHFCATDLSPRFQRIASDLLSTPEGSPLSLELVEV